MSVPGNISFLVQGGNEGSGNGLHDIRNPDPSAQAAAEQALRELYLDCRFVESHEAEIRAEFLRLMDENGDRLWPHTRHKG
jgi:hypothetical protein